MRVALLTLGLLACGDAAPDTTAETETLHTVKPGAPPTVMVGRPDASAPAPTATADDAGTALPGDSGPGVHDASNGSPRSDAAVLESADSAVDAGARSSCLTSDGCEVGRNLCFPECAPECVEAACADCGEMGEPCCRSPLEPCGNGLQCLNGFEICSSAP